MTAMVVITPLAATHLCYIVGNRLKVLNLLHASVLYLRKFLSTATHCDNVSKHSSANIVMHATFSYAN